MSIQELANLPISVRMNGNDYKIQRLSIKEIWGVAEQKITQDYYTSVQQIASGLSQADKVAYLRDATKSIPRGSEMQDARSEFLQSIDGIALILKTALNKFQKVDETEIFDIIVNDSASIEFVINYLMGISNEEKKDSITDSSDQKKK